MFENYNFARLTPISFTRFSKDKYSVEIENRNPRHANLAVGCAVRVDH